MLNIRRTRYWSPHTHSEYSAKDAIGTVESIVDRARELGYKGLAITDHGNIAASVELYQNCKRQGIKPFPGSEMYLVMSRSDKEYNTKRFHFGLVAYTTQGYRNLVYISTLSHQNFYHFPILDLADLARLYEEGRTEGIALTTGCFFGWITQTLINEGPREARKAVATLSKWFKVYVEIQRHNITDNDEDWVADQLERIADDLGLGIVLGQDSHYTHPEYQPIHDSLKGLVSWSDDPDEAVFPGDGFHMADDQWMIDHHGQRLFDKAMESHDELLAMHDMLIPEMEEYAYRIPHIVDDPAATLKARVGEVMTERGFDSDPSYVARIMTELNTVNLAGMSDYFLLVSDVCQYMRDQGIDYQTRGSAAGSLIAYLLRITNVDPIIWGTSFDRFMGRPSERYLPRFEPVEKTFRYPDEIKGLADIRERISKIPTDGVTQPWVTKELALLATNDKAVKALIKASKGEALALNPDHSIVAFLLGITVDRPTQEPVSTVVIDRKSPPDIDLDVDNQRRDEVIEWLDSRYSVSPIGNWSELGFREDDDEAGSILIKYFSVRRRKLRREGHDDQYINEQCRWENIPTSDRNMLRKVSELKPFSGYGTHACGLILCNSRSELSEMVPQMWVANSKTLVSQFHMKRVEEIGLVKLDLLGSKTVTVMSRAAKELGYNSIEDLKLDPKFSYEDKEVYQAMGKGRTDGVFQLEGYSSMMGVKDMKPKNIHDVIAAMALYRPAAMDAGATEEFLNVRKGKKKSPKRHQIIQQVIGETNGIFLYQDQVVDLLRFLGMDPTNLTSFLKAIKASNKNTADAERIIAFYMPLIKDMCDAHGVGEDDWKWLEHTLTASAGYGFNRSHATVYGITAYMTQWLQVHHPDVFFANLISVHVEDDKKVTKYESASRSWGVKILRADINESDAVDYRVVKPGVIRRPLRTIKGVGGVAATCIVEAQPYTDFDDFLNRVNRSKVTGVKDFKPGETTPEQLKGTLKFLHNASAVSSLGGVPVGESNAD